jgi:GT2 family glycosyltransferase
MRISGSLVLYQTSQDEYEAVIKSFLTASDDGDFYVIDNSQTPSSSNLFSHPRVKYRHIGKNIGFGAAHNQAIRACCPTSDLHLIVNPDIRFERRSIVDMTQYFNLDPDLVAAMPKIKYPNGELQRLCKLLPTPTNLFIRRFIPISKIRNAMNFRYELHSLPQDHAIEVPTISGCFLLARSKELIAINGFDPRFFMYLEDVDLVRRLSSRGAIQYLPTSSVIHSYAKGSYGNIKLLRYHISSAIKYFHKWGWIFDDERIRINNKMLSKLNRP